MDHGLAFRASSLGIDASNLPNHTQTKMTIHSDELHLPHLDLNGAKLTGAASNMDAFFDVHILRIIVDQYARKAPSILRSYIYSVEGRAFARKGDLTRYMNTVDEIDKKYHCRYRKCQGRPQPALTNLTSIYKNIIYIQNCFPSLHQKANMSEIRVLYVLP
jgi:hypothetical protein